MRNAIKLTIVGGGLLGMALAGCTHIPNQWREDGPATKEAWLSPTARQVCRGHDPAPQRQRGWEPSSCYVACGAVTHWPLYFEDPFVDKGHGRQGMNKYFIGWEDYVGMPYVYARYTLNWLMLPFSPIVTPPCTVMASDGELSRQLLGYDHDAEPIPYDQAYGGKGPTEDAVEDPDIAGHEDQAAAS